jgi:hypothetical protein
MEARGVCGRVVRVVDFKPLWRDFGKLYGNLQFQEEMRISLPCSGQTLTQSFGPWLVMQYAYRAKIVYALLLCNYWQEINKTLWELLIPRDVHIVALLKLFRPDTSLQSDGPWFSYILEQYCYFFAAAVLISTKLYGNHGYTKAIYISLACPDITI